MTTWYVILGVAAVVAVASRRARGGVAPEFEGGPPASLAAPDVNVLDYIKAGSQYFYAPEGQAPRQITREQYEAAIAAAR